MKTKINKTNHDNYATFKNKNLHTGTTGSKAKDFLPQAKIMAREREFIQTKEVVLLFQFKKQKN